jgi:hypothetical protein
VQPGNNMGSSSTGGTPDYTITQTNGGYGTTLLDTPLYASPTDIEVQLPDIDHRENTTNMDEVKGVTIIYYPPYNACETEDMLNHFKELNWDREYHYVIGNQVLLLSIQKKEILEILETKKYQLQKLLKQNLQ